MVDDGTTETCLENYVRTRVAVLEKETYGHSDNADDITEQIMDIVNISGVRETFVKQAIANEVVLLLENYRFGG